VFGRVAVETNEDSDYLTIGDRVLAFQLCNQQDNWRHLTIRKKIAPASVKSTIPLVCRLAERHNYAGESSR